MDFLSPLNRYEIDYTEGGDWSPSPPMQFDDPVIQEPTVDTVFDETDVQFESATTELIFEDESMQAPVRVLWEIDELGNWWWSWDGENWWIYLE